MIDFDAAPTPTRWLVRDLLVRGKTHLLSGPTGGFKSGFVAGWSRRGRPGARFSAGK